MNLLILIPHLILARIAHDEDGQGLTEYALVLALIAILAVGALHFLGGHVTSVLSDAGNSL